MARPTPFHTRTQELCASYEWQEWSGFLTANSYDLNHLREYYAIRTAAGLIDISPLYKYHITGPDAGALLNRVVTRDVAKLKTGAVMYTPWCDDDGKIIDDGTIQRLEDGLYRLTAADPTLRWLLENVAGLDVSVEDVTEDYAALSLQGPLSRTILSQLAGDDLSKLGFFKLIHTTLAGKPVAISRTGFTGDLGYEIWLDPADAMHIWDSLLEAGRPYKIRPVGQTAMDISRIEAGLLLVQVDFISAMKTMYAVQKTTPFDLGLSWAVSLDKGPFIGRAALVKEKASGSQWNTTGLIVDYESLVGLYARYGMPVHVPDSPWWDDRPIYAGQSQIGRATCGVWSPILKSYIALARLKPEYAKPGMQVGFEETIESHRHRAEAAVTALPFYDPPRKKQ